MYTDKTCLLLAVIIFSKTVKLVQGGQNKGLWRHVSSIKFDTQLYFIIQFRIILVHTFIYEVFLKDLLLSKRLYSQNINSQKIFLTIYISDNLFKHKYLVYFFE